MTDGFAYPTGAHNCHMLSLIAKIRKWLGLWWEALTAPEQRRAPRATSRSLLALDDLLTRFTER
jgi:hypothetical protein